MNGRVFKEVSERYNRSLQVFLLGARISLVLLVFGTIASPLEAQSCVRSVPNHDYVYSYSDAGRNMWRQRSVGGPYGGDRRTLSRGYQFALDGCDIVARNYSISNRDRLACRAHMTRIFESYYPRMCR